MSFFSSGGAGDAGSGSADIGTPAAPDYTGDPTASTSGAPAAPNPNADVGKFDINLSDLGGSVEGALSGAVGLAGGLVGGAAGLVGGIGAGGGTIGGAVANAAGAVGQVAGAVGSVPLPFIRNQFTPAGAQGATVGDIPGEVGKIIGLPGQAIQRTFAGQRVQNDQPNLPADIEMRLQSGQLTVDQAADELVARGQGFTNARMTNLGLSILLDPTNYIGLGVGKLGALAGDAGIAVKAAQVGDDLGIGQRIIGTAYNGLMRGLPGAARATMDRALGATTDGVIRSLGPGTVTDLIDRAGQLSPDYAAAIQDGLGVGITNITNAAVADSLFRRSDAIAERLRTSPADALDAVAATASQLQALDPDRFSRLVDNYMDRVKGQFSGMTPDAIRAQTAQLLSTTTGMSVDEALHTLPESVSVNLAATVRASAYGKAVSDLDAAKAASLGAVTDFGAGYGVRDLTLLAPDTLTAERAGQLLKLRAGDALDAAVDRYDMLRNRFSGRPYTVADIRQYLKAVSDGLPHQLNVPKSGEHALPPALGEMRAQWRSAGYDLGFAPQGGLRSIVTAGGDTIPLHPFLPASSDRTPVAIRNPLGRAVDAMLRGIDQTKIIATAKARWMRYATIDHQLLTPQEATRLFGAILDRAVDTNTAVRGLGGREAYQAIFRDVLGDTRLAQFRAAGGDPTFLVNHAFENDWRNVGATQALTGRLKTVTSPSGNIVAHMAEGVYPVARYTISPVFQLQNIIETPIMAALRGIAPWSLRKANLDSAAAGVVRQAIADDHTVALMMEAGATMGFVGDRVAGEAVSNPQFLGRIASHLPPIREWKQRAQLAQILHEHPEVFRSTIATLNPKLVRIMEDAYGTKDWATIARQWAEERLTLAQHPDGAPALARTFLPGTTNADELTVYNAFQYSLQQSARASVQTQFFQPERSWLLRTINHPYLGLYPASYMWGHVLPEFARFLLVRPFGLHAPLAGLAALNNVQRNLAAELADPTSDLAKFVIDHPETTYVLNQLLPGDPTSLGANVAYPVRHAITTGSLNAFPGDVEAIPSHLGLPRDIGYVAKIGAEFTSAPKRAQPQSLSELLDQSAAQYNTWVLPSLQRSVAAADQSVMANLDENR